VSPLENAKTHAFSALFTNNYFLVLLRWDYVPIGSQYVLLQRSVSAFGKLVSKFPITVDRSAPAATGADGFRFIPLRSTPRSVPPSPKRRRPRSPDTARCFRVSCGRLVSKINGLGQDEQIHLSAADILQRNSFSICKRV
jgi:hypothetical protein